MRAGEVKCKVSQRNSIRPEESEAWPRIVHPSVGGIRGSREIRQGTRLARLIVAFVGLLLLSSAYATGKVRTVKPTGGDYTSIQACANVAVAGDTCVVYTGTYSETVTPAHSGGSGTPITFSVNPGDCVTVTGWSLGSLSYITIGTPGSSVCSSGGVTFSGFEITRGHIAFTAISHVIIQNNYIHNTDNTCLRGPAVLPVAASSYDSVLNNTFIYCGGLTYDTGMESSMNVINGDHWLIDGNNISHVSEGIQLYGDKHVVRRNVIGPVTAAEEEENHGDGLEYSCGSGAVPLTRMLYEQNVTHDWRGANNHVFLFRNTGFCAMNTNIIRYSAAYQIGSGWAANDTNSTGTHSYNLSISNTNIDSGGALESWTVTNGDTDNKVVNVIQTSSWLTSGNIWCLYVDPSSASGFVENHNLCYNGSDHNWQGPPSTGGNSYDASDIFNQDPLFVDPSSNLNLQSGSPALRAGGPVTTVAVGDSGSGTSLVVNDAAYFSDGNGIVNADWIRVGASTTVQISSINYATNTITLASGISRSSGNPVYLYKDSAGNVVLTGTQPNIGAFDLGSRPAPPTNLTAVPH